MTAQVQLFYQLINVTLHIVLASGVLGLEAPVLLLNHTPVGKLKIVIFVFGGSIPTYFSTLIPNHPS